MLYSAERDFRTGPLRASGETEQTITLQVLVALALIAWFFAVGCCSPRGDTPWAPDDAWMRQRWSDHRKAFDALASMLAANPAFSTLNPNSIGGPGGVCQTPGRGAGPPFQCNDAGTFSAAGDIARQVGLPSALIDDVRALVERAGACSMSHTPSGEITLWLTCGHDASWGKDWVFKSSRPAPIVADTTRDRRTDLEVFAELGAGWYIRRAGSVP